MLRSETNDYVGEFGEVHGRRSQESGDESVRRVIVHLGRRAQLVDHAFVQDQYAIAHGHGFHLVVRDIDGSGAHSAVKTLEFFSRRGAQLGVQIGEGFI